MKEIKQCSISGLAFTLEVDAYEKLHNYIKCIRARYNNNADGDEIIADIEARVAELILQVNPSNNVVAKPLIDNIIKQLGTVDDICDDYPNQPRDEKTEKTESFEYIKRKLYRNIDDAPISGVCSGIAAYLGCSTELIRIITLLIVIFGGVSILIYIVLWLAIPPAITASQKLEMRGEPITASTIKDFYKTTTQNKRNRSIAAAILNGIGRILMVIFKILLILILTAMILALLALIVGIFSMIVLSSGLEIDWVICAISIMALLSIAILLMLGIYIVQKLINSQQVKGRTIITTLLIWMILTIATAAALTINNEEISDKVEELKAYSGSLFSASTSSNTQSLTFEEL